jgi:hypothetical protein
MTQDGEPGTSLVAIQVVSPSGSFGGQPDPSHPGSPRQAQNRHRNSRPCFTHGSQEHCSLVLKAAHDFSQDYSLDEGSPASHPQSRGLGCELCRTSISPAPPPASPKSVILSELSEFVAPRCSAQQRMQTRVEWTCIFPFSRPITSAMPTFTATIAASAQTLLHKALTPKALSS